MTIIYAIIFCLIIIIEYRRIKSKKWDYFTVFTILYLLKYVLPGIYDLRYISYIDIEQQFHLNLTDNLIVFILISFSYVLFRTIYIFFDKRNMHKVAYSSISHIINIKRILLFSALGLASFYIYFLQFGDTGNTAFEIYLARAGANPYRGQFVFLKHFIPLLTISCVLSYSYYLFLVKDGLRYKSKYVIIITTLIFFLIIFLYIYLGGRSHYLKLIFSLLLVYITVRNKIAWWHILILCASVTFLLFFDSFYMYFLGIKSNYIIKPVSSNLIDNFVRAFGHSYISLKAVTHLYLEDVINYRYFIDYILAILYLIPDKIFSFSVPSTVSYINTYHLLGVYSSTVPPGLIASGIYFGGLPGLTINIFISAAFLSWLNNKMALHGYSKISEASAYNVGIYSVSGIYFCMGLMNGDPRVFLFDILPICFFIVAVFILDKINICVQKSSHNNLS
ncbi:MAG: oligosaccharide repeat unit polymerase [Deltaproteobacteria bacterium]|nr:oligosaccharide repeat unit polymerase [Deltaproteobacteria bacterium]